MTDQELISIGKAAIALMSLVAETARAAPDGGEHLISKYGESCTRKAAGEIIGKTPSSVTRMICDGRLKTVPGSTKVDTHSIIRYLAEAKQKDFEARMHKRGKNPRMCIMPSK